MSETTLGELITSFQRPRNQTTQRLFGLMVILTIACLLFLLIDGLAFIAIACYIPAILGAAFGITMIRDKDQTIEIYRRGMITRNVQDGGVREQVLWEEISNIFGTNNESLLLGGLFGLFTGSGVGSAVSLNSAKRVGETHLPTEINFVFKTKHRPVSLGWTYQMAFQAIAESAVAYWLAETNDQLRRAQRVPIGKWEISEAGLSTGKDLIPWNAILQVVGDRDMVTVVYREQANNKEKRIWQTAYLKGSLLGALTVQMQTTGIPAANG